jgi:hypothetical protein
MLSRYDRCHRPSFGNTAFIEYQGNYVISSSSKQNGKLSYRNL